MIIRTTLPGTAQQKAIRIDAISEALIEEGYQIEEHFWPTHGAGWEIMSIETDTPACQRIIERMIAAYEAADNTSPPTSTERLFDALYALREEMENG